jgi:hypothetical protein
VENFVWLESKRTFEEKSIGKVVWFEEVVEIEYRW